MGEKSEGSLQEVLLNIDSELGSDAVKLTRGILGSFALYGVGGNAKDINVTDRPEVRVITDLALKAKTGDLKYSIPRRNFEYLDRNGKTHILVASDPLFRLIGEAAIATHRDLPRRFSEEQKGRAVSATENQIGYLLVDILDGVRKYF